MKKLFIALLGLATLTACQKDDKEEVVKAERTVLVYMAGENGLTSYINEELKEMMF